MNKQEFAAKMAEINKQRTSLKDEEQRLKDQYEKENCPYFNAESAPPVTVATGRGERVKAFIVNWRVDMDGEFIYSLQKAKKDGTQSSVNFPYYDYDQKSIQDFVEPLTNH